MARPGMLADVERWLIHGGLSFKESSESDDAFRVMINQAGRYGISMEIFEPRAQPGVLVVGAKVAAKNNQTARYLAFSPDEKKKFEQRVGDFCRSIKAVNRNTVEDGRLKVGVYVVLDGKRIIQQDMFDAIDAVSEMHEKTVVFLARTF